VLDALIPDNHQITNNTFTPHVHAIVNI